MVRHIQSGDLSLNSDCHFFAVLIVGEQVTSLNLTFPLLYTQEY